MAIQGVIAGRIKTGVVIAAAARPPPPLLCVYLRPMSLLVSNTANNRNKEFFKCGNNAISFLFATSAVDLEASTAT
jgi:hypothetical protein